MSAAVALGPDLSSSLPLVVRPAAGSPPRLLPPPFCTGFCQGRFHSEAVPETFSLSFLIQ